jgi:hypothetical protein
MNMKNIFKIYLLSFFLLSDFMVFADPGDGGDDGENPEDPTDPEPLPINSKLIWLAILGILFIIYKRKELKKLSE